MSELEDRLRGLPELVVDDGPGPAEIRVRAAARVRRRRLLVAAPLVIVAIAAVAAVVWLGGRDESETVTAGPPTAATTPATSTSTTGVPATLPPGMAPSGLTAVPVLDLRDGQTITVTFDRPDEAELIQFVAACAGEVVDLAYLEGLPPDDLLSWCTEPAPNPGASTDVTVERMLTTPDGTVDCAANVGRCVVAASLRTAPGGTARAMLWTAIGFEPVDQGPLTIEVDSTAVDDGERVTVSGDGGLPGETVMISQCTSEQGWRGSDLQACDSIRGIEAPVGDDGRYHATFFVFREFLTYAPDGKAFGRWADCDPCFLFAARANGQGEPATAPIAVADTDDPIHPRIEIVEPGPHRPGERVTLRGSGFQSNSNRDSFIWVCPADLSGPYDGGCSIDPSESKAIPGPDGTFEISDFALPDADYRTSDGTRCASARACALGSAPGEALVYLLSQPLDLTG